MVCERAAGVDTSNPINGYKMDKVGGLPKGADSNAWWCVVCRSSRSTRFLCWTALTPLRYAAGVDGGVAEVARRDLSGTALTGKVSLDPSRSVARPIRKIEGSSGFLQVDGSPFVRLGLGDVRQ